VKKPLVLAAAAVAVVTGVLRRRHARADAADLWREATSDASR
jgi:hypothetical protein